MVAKFAQNVQTWQPPLMQWVQTFAKLIFATGLHKANFVQIRRERGRYGPPGLGVTVVFSRILFVIQSHCLWIWRQDDTGRIQNSLEEDIVL